MRISNNGDIKLLKRMNQFYFIFQKYWKHFQKLQSTSSLTQRSWDKVVIFYQRFPCEETNLQLRSAILDLIESIKYQAKWI
jgi:ATP sulfurylase